jgi:polysaccharide biosynthesis transport protein
MQEILPYQNGGVPGPSLDAFAHRWLEINRSVRPEPEQDLRQYWRIIHKHLRLIGACLLGAALLTVLLVLTQTPMYTATSLVMIEPRAPQVFRMKEMVSEPLAANEYDFYKTQYDIVRSRSLAAQVIRALDLEDVPYFNGKDAHKGLIAGIFEQSGEWLRGLFVHPAPGGSADDQSDGLGVDPALIDAYLGGLSVEPRIGTHLVTVGFSTPDRMLSARIANAHVKAYIRRGIDLHSQASGDAEDFLQKKLLELKERVEKSEAALNAYRRDRGIVTFSLHDTSGVIMHRLDDLNTALTKSETTRIALAAQHQLIHRGDYDSLPEVINSQLIQRLKEEISTLGGQYAAMRNRFNPGYHPLDDLRARLKDNRARLHSEIRSVVQSVELDYQAALSKEKQLEKQIDDVKSRAMALHDASLQDAVLAREVDTNRQLYASVLERVKEIGVSADEPTSNVSIVDQAEIPRHRSSPKVMQSLGMGSFLGLCIGIGLAFLLEHMDDRLKDAEEAERYLKVPSLAVVPPFARLNGGYGYGARAKRVEALEQNKLTDDHQSKEIVVTSNRLSAAGEIYRAIRTSLLFSRAGSPPKTILITSATGDEGKTVTAINSAMAFSQTGAQILLIDTDLRKSRCHKVLGFENYLGLTQVLVGQRPFEEVVHQTEYPGLSFLSAGPSSPNPSELLASDEMRELLHYLGTRYDYVVLDSAPVIPVTDSVALSTMVDGVLLVVGRQTAKQLVQTTCTRLNHVGSKILGLVLNGVGSHGHGGYQYYNHYYSYGREEDTTLSKASGTIPNTLRAAAHKIPTLLRSLVFDNRIN